MSNAGEKLRILFLCTGNSCRSQMAEGWARELKSEIFDAFSAGTAPQGLNPNAVKVMREAGVDISNQTSKHIDAFQDQKLDVIVTVCGSAKEQCPVMAGSISVVHVGFDDPPALAKEAASEEVGLEHYRRVRDEIQQFVERLPGAVLEELK